MMAASKLTLHLMCLLWTEVHFAQVSVLEQQKSFITTNAGGTVTLQCFYQGSTLKVNYWYKQHLGDKPERITSKVRHNNATSTDPRFTVISGEGINHLKISDVRMSDSALYYCGKSDFTEIQFKVGVMLHVKGSSSSIRAIVQQPPETSARPGESVTLNCTVQTEPGAGEHSVYWFKTSGESQPVFFYTRDQGCETANATQGSFHFHNFSVKNIGPTDAGSYYCAVASCGRILYGNGTRLDVCTADNGLLVVVYCLSFTLVVFIVLVIIMASFIYKLKRTGHPLGSSASPTNTAQQNEDGLHYAALSLNKKRRPRPLAQSNNNMENDTVYAGVRV